MPRRTKAMAAPSTAGDLKMAETAITGTTETALSSRVREESPLSEPPGEENSEEVEVPKAAKKQRAKRKTVKPPIVDGEEDGSANEKPRKKRRRKTPEEDKVYEMSPIDNVLDTTFKGRLGYACLNSLMRSYSTSIFCSRTCRLATLAELGHSHVQALALQNLADLHTIIKWNAENNIYFMRMSSEMFPFASHPVHGYDLSFADDVLKEIGNTAKRLGVRLTSHPGQFTQLGSPRDNVVENAFRDLKYHCELMDRMGLDQDSIMIIHMGGTFGDKEAALERFKVNYAKLPENVKGRLVLENDELCYNVDDLLPICRELNIPMVFDYHHDWIYPSSRPPEALIPDINELWHRKGIKPKQHYSEPRPGAETVMEKRAHSDRVVKLPAHLPDDMDLMLECKDKEQAVFYLYRLYNLFPVDPRVLRPPVEVESLHTNGRKSNKRARAKAKAEEEVESKVAREAEEHGVPLDKIDTKVIIAEGALECGSGDEEVMDVDKARTKVEATEETKLVLENTQDGRKRKRQSHKRNSGKASIVNDKSDANERPKNDSKRRRPGKATV